MKHCFAAAAQAAAADFICNFSAYSLRKVVIYGPICTYPAAAITSTYEFSKALARLRAFGRLQTKGGFARWTAATRTD